MPNPTLDVPTLSTGWTLLLLVPCAVILGGLLLIAAVGWWRWRQVRRAALADLVARGSVGPRPWEQL